MATAKKPVTSSPAAAPVAAAPDNSALEARVKALEERVEDLIKRLGKKMSF